MRLFLSAFLTGFIACSALGQEAPPSLNATSPLYSAQKPPSDPLGIYSFDVRAITLPPQPAFAASPNPAARWTPNSPLNYRDTPWQVAATAHTSFAAMGVAGALTIGTPVGIAAFSVIALYNLAQAWHIIKSPKPKTRWSSIFSS